MCDDKGYCRIGDFLTIHSKWCKTTAADRYHCFISSHGDVKGKGFITVPDGVFVVFYGPHGNMIVDPGINSLNNGKIKIFPYEIKGPGSQIHNYELRKYQGKHGEKTETYERIAEVVQQTEENIIQGRIDIATIRYRQFKKNPATLKYIMEQFAEANLGYKVYHCCFCRGAGEAWSAGKNAPRDWNVPAAPRQSIPTANVNVNQKLFFKEFYYWSILGEPLTKTLAD